MGRFYNSTPWVIPEAPDELKVFFKSHGELLTVRRGDVVCGSVVNSAPYGLDDLIYIESGFLAQAYFTANPNKPKAISIALKGRVLNYASFLGFDNRGENLIAKKKSSLYAIKRDVLEALLAQEPRFAQLLQTYCIACVASDYDAFTCMFTCDVEERILYFFQSLVRTFQCKCQDDWFVIPFKLSYTDMSEVVFSSKKMIERIIPAWGESGLFVSNKDSFALHQSIFDKIREG